ncbi:energy transducer TonB [Desulfosarcina sp.]|uniref:energy transducer TonB n=1 Tax=Desulfosarcina sp. TaxID=2027861 RepID=UPI00397048DA
MDHGYAPPRGNRLLTALVMLSVLAHLLALRLFGNPSPVASTHMIELSLSPSYQAAKRHIPTPRQQPLKAPPQRRSQPEPRPIFPDVSVAKASAAPLQPQPLDSRIPDLAGLTPSPIIAFEKTAMPPAAHSSSDERAARTYFDIIRSRINSHKSYPLSARQRKEEGAVTVRFTLSADGWVASADVIEGTSSVALRQAALEAVRQAAPFPVIPASMAKREITIRLTIHFELDIDTSR